ncbi:hypothetical protein C8Q78DRAFT_410263 [Trametes maxima]|nr:hypothetical protein C8Q78DRAFT_410263 [Trametes maxima]
MRLTAGEPLGLMSLRPALCSQYRTILSLVCLTAMALTRRTSLSSRGWPSRYLVRHAIRWLFDSMERDGVGA